MIFNSNAENNKSIYTKPKPEYNHGLGKTVIMKVALYNNNNQKCKINLLGIHFNWQSKERYYICSDISEDLPRLLCPGGVEVFNINLDKPINYKTNTQNYDIIIQYELQDGWFGEWNHYRWQSDPTSNLNNLNQILNQKNLLGNDKINDTQNIVSAEMPLDNNISINEEELLKNNKNEFNNKIKINEQLEDKIGNDGLNNQAYENKDSVRIDPDTVTTSEPDNLKNSENNKQSNYGNIISLPLFGLIILLITFLISVYFRIRHLNSEIRSRTIHKKRIIKNINKRRPKRITKIKIKRLKKLKKC
jgi:hypothetical protein